MPRSFVISSRPSIAALIGCGLLALFGGLLAELVAATILKSLAALVGA